MEVEYCVGLCPLCQGNGMLRVVKDGRGIFISCDECYREFLTPRDALINKALLTSTFNNVSIDIDEAIAQGWEEYIYVLENGKWVNYKDKSKELLDEYPKVKQLFEKLKNN